MRTVDRDDWTDLCGVAEDLVWRVVDAQPSATPPPNRIVNSWRASEGNWHIFLLGLGVAGRPRNDPRLAVGAAFRCYLAGGSRAQVWTHGTMATALVALAAKVGPSGPFAEEVLALASTMLMSGLTVVEDGT